MLRQNAVRGIVVLLTAALVFPEGSRKPSGAQQNSAQNVSLLAERVDRRYNALQTLTAEFTEIYHGVGIERRESGTLILKKPGKMHWEYRSPHEKLLVSDGKTAYFYVPGEGQARRAEVGELDDLHSPLRYLLGKTRLAKEFEHLALAGDVAPYFTGDVVLRGVPRMMQDRVSQVLLEIGPQDAILRIVIQERDGAVTEFRFTNLSENVNVRDALFRFTPPPGVQVIEGQELVP